MTVTVTVDLVGHGIDIDRIHVLDRALALALGVKDPIPKIVIDQVDVVENAAIIRMERPAVVEAKVQVERNQVDRNQQPR